MQIYKHIDPGLIDQFNLSLPGDVHENHAGVAMGEQPKYLGAAELKRSNSTAQLITNLSRFTNLMSSSIPLQREGQHTSLNIESGDEANKRSKSIERALNTFLSQGKEAISNLLSSFARIASKIPKEEPALT